MKPVRETRAQPLQTAPIQTISEAEAYRLLVKNESGGRYDAINPTSGACGILQSLPCDAMPCTLDDQACQNAYFTRYMVKRYTTWARAWAYWNCIGQCTNNYGTITKTTVWW